MGLKIKDRLKKLFSWYLSKSALPYWSVVFVDFIIVFSSNVIAHLLNYGIRDYASKSAEAMILSTVLPLVCYFIGFRVFRTYRGVIRYSSFYDLLHVLCAVFLSSALLFCILKIFGHHLIITEALNQRDILMMAVFSTILMWTERLLLKTLFDELQVKDKAPSALIVGTKFAGIGIAKSIRVQNPSPYHIAGFITDDPQMTAFKLLGLRVLYAQHDEVYRFIRNHNIKVILVSPLAQEYFVNECQTLIDFMLRQGIKIMLKPEDIEWDGKSDISHQFLKEVSVENLLPRKKIEVDMEAIGKMLKGKRILITGAAGSIGSEMVRQVAKFSLEELVLVDQAETPMHDIRLLMARKYPDIKAFTIVGSIANPTHMEEIFKEHRPEYVFHAAAYKHVPMMEDNPAMAIQNNVFGTRVIADLAVKYGTKKFVMISTDKAVNPTNVMGCSKRICEIYCQSLNKAIADNLAASSAGNAAATENAAVSEELRQKLLQVDGSPAVTQFVTTRFGNVLGSNGSVIPIFEEQIKKGGPVTVTHPDIIRFFMLIPEACRLVLEAGTMGNGGEIFVFDMGMPVRIADLAQRMILQMGAKNVEIKYTGLRDGEKLYEEVLSEDEHNKPTNHPRIMVASVREYPFADALRNEEELYNISLSYDDMAIVKKMMEIVPEYHSQHSKYEVLNS